jgi:hypothetical protein
MKRKPLFPIPLADLKTLPTKQLLGRLKQLHQCEQSLALSDIDSVDVSDSIQFKESADWIIAYKDVKQILSTREHIPRRAPRLKNIKKKA